MTACVCIYIYIYIYPNNRIDWKGFGKNCRGLIAVLSRHLPGGTEEVATVVGITGIQADTDLNPFQPGYNDIGLCDTSSITSYSVVPFNS